MLISGESASRIRLVDHETRIVREVTSSRPPNTMTFTLSPDDRTLYYLVTELEADVYRLRPLP